MTGCGSFFAVKGAGAGGLADDYWKYFYRNSDPATRRSIDRLEKKQEAIQRKAEDDATLPEPKKDFYPTETVATFCTDTGNAARLVKRHGRDILYCGKWDKWVIWDGTRWKPDDNLEIVRLAKDTALSLYDEAQQAAKKGTDNIGKLTQWAARSQERAKVEAMISLAPPECPIMPDKLDADAFLLNVENFTIDLRTGEARPHKQEDLITKLAPVKYDQQAECPRWLQFLSEIFDKDQNIIGYVQRLAGMCCTGDASEQTLHILYGTGANGKSTFTDTLTALLGDYAGEAVPDLLLMKRGSEHPTEIADLCGKRLVIAAETGEGRHLNAEVVKRLTGNARLKARFMRQDNFEFLRTFKLMLTTNNRPRISESTHAIRRRISLIPFNVVIPPEQQDKSLLQKLRGEFPGILNWLIEGCLTWQYMRASPLHPKCRRQRVNIWPQRTCWPISSGTAARSITSHGLNAGNFSRRMRNGLASRGSDTPSEAVLFMPAFADATGYRKRRSAKA